MQKEIKHTADYLKLIRSKGIYSFTSEDLLLNVPKSLINIRKDLDRLRAKDEISTIRKGFYTIIPIEYQNVGGIPIEFYIDHLMNYISKPYYVGLFSAAMFHGAAHQQPQAFFVVANAPKPRNILYNDFLLSFTERRIIPTIGIEKMKTDTGYFNVSGKELTFLDLIYFENQMGGYNRIITVLQELSEGIKISKMKEALKNDFPISTIQRAGFISENILENSKLAGVFKSKLQNSQYKTVLLKPAGQKEGEFNADWKVIVNIQISSDL